ncbi:MAG: hypothetical protein ACLF0G_13300, partial [Candidatus Brocadiia bacterium]
MAPYSPHQRRIIRRYYDRKPDIMLQRLGEVASQLAIEEDPAAQRRLWRRAETALKNLKVPSWRIARILEARDPALLAKVVE